MDKKETNCPVCGNHCNKDDLKCGRGKNYFGLNGEDGRRGGDRPHGAPFNKDEDPTVTLLRRCGHLLHHGGVENILAPLSEEEKKTLGALLNKCLSQTEKSE